MSLLLHPRNLFIWLTYLVLSSVPFFSLTVGHPVANWMQIVGMEFISWTALWAIFKRPALFHWALIPAFLALPVELYLHAYYGQGISTHHLGIIAETSPKEALEFLGDKVWLLGAIAVGVVAWWWLVGSAARRTRDLDWTDNSRWFTLGVLALGFGVWLYGEQVGVQ